MLKSSLNFCINPVHESNNIHNENDIAVIGMSGQFSFMNDTNEFWNNLLKGMDCIRMYPKKRFNDVSHFVSKEKRLCEGGYLEDIADFDYKFFGISAKEAQYMDPNQRIFLETAYHALEDAGYAGESIKGSNTGVYIGHSSDITTEYHHFVEKFYKDQYDNISVPGNIKSVIASRIAYFLDLKGPSISIDTACSSSLVAVHIACNALRDREINMAITGGVKINILPIQEGLDHDIGIRSAKDRTCTFDDSSDGISSGEGSAALVLKRLDQAVQDGDHIYAVIKGSAVNQDGNSVGLTAPNPKAQELVIQKAWEKAKINPEDFVYMEAHGTGTRLGDPIEVAALDQVFKKYTNKKAFCAIGSVKANIGHLDNVSGMAGLFKVVLMLRYGVIPPLIHFNRPNRRIHFSDSVFYVNDRVQNFGTKEKCLCGINSFGLSGTNCHIVLEKYEPKVVLKQEENPNHIFTLSACRKEQLKELAQRYLNYIENCKSENLSAICYTAVTGRAHLNCRLAFVADSLNKIKYFLKSYIEDNYVCGLFTGSFKVIDGSDKKSDDVITTLEQEQMTKKSRKLLDNDTTDLQEKQGVLEEICSLYVNGANVPFNLLYENRKVKKAELPLYPFERCRCWVEENGAEDSQKLIDKCLVKTDQETIYSTVFSSKTHWLLREHKVSDKYVLPGTAYIELIIDLVKNQGKRGVIQLQDLFFLTPLALQEDEEREVITILKRNGCFTIASWEYGQWVEHATGKVLLEKIIYRFENMKTRKLPDLSQLRKIEETSEREIEVRIGRRWTDIEKILFKVSKQEYMSVFSIPGKYEKDFRKAVLYPPALDRAMNAVNAVVGSGTYLPFSVKSLRVYDQMPLKFYSMVMKKKEDLQEKSFVFDVALLDEKGRVFAEVEDFMIKQIKESGFSVSHKNMYHCIQWEEKALDIQGDGLSGKTVMIIGTKDNNSCERLAVFLKDSGCKVIQAEQGDTFVKLSENKYQVGFCQNDYNCLIEEVKQSHVQIIVHGATWNTKQKITDIEELEETQKQGIYSLFYLVKALNEKEVHEKKELILLSDSVFSVHESDRYVMPEKSTLFAMGKVINQEFLNIHCRCIDYDDCDVLFQLLDEISYGKDSYHCVYRNHVRYVDKMAVITDMMQRKKKNLVLRKNGTYLIAGGSGGLGVEFGKFLSKKTPVNLIVLGRKEERKDTDWIRFVKQIKESGSNIKYYACDITNQIMLKEVLSKARKQFGSIHGVIQCAGAAGNTLICKDTLENFREVLSPKVYGTWLLDHLTRKDSLDFFILCSSITALVGGIGQSGYTAANAFLDSYSVIRNQLGNDTLAINWAAWKETGMAYRYGIDEERNTLYSLSTEEALEAFHVLIGRKLENVIVGQIHEQVFQKFYNNPVTRKSDTFIRDEFKTEKKEVHAFKETQEITLTGGRENETISDTEKTVAIAWYEVLGAKEINVYDNFNDIGGNSILAVKLLAEMQKLFGDIIDITSIFTYPTINQMARYIDSLLVKGEEAKMDKRNNSDELDDLLEKLAKGEIDVREAEKLF